MNDLNFTLFDITKKDIRTTLQDQFKGKDIIIYQQKNERKYGLIVGGRESNSKKLELHITKLDPKTGKPIPKIFNRTDSKRKGKIEPERSYWTISPEDLLSLDDFNLSHDEFMKKVENAKFLLFKGYKKESSFNSKEISFDIENTINLIKICNDFYNGEIY